MLQSYSLGPYVRGQVNVRFNRHGVHVENWGREGFWFFYELDSVRAEKRRGGARLYFILKNGTEELAFSSMRYADAETVAEDINFCIKKVRAEADEVRQHKKRVNTWERNMRLAVMSSQRAKHILRDSKKSDKRYKRKNSLTAEFIDSVICNPCHYCGISPRETMMSLDRINSAKGHTKKNVLPSCVNCNLTRGNMPFQAWMLLVPGMKKARKERLLEGWDRTNRLNRKQREPEHIRPEDQLNGN